MLGEGTAENHPTHTNITNRACDVAVADSTYRNHYARVHFTHICHAQRRFDCLFTKFWKAIYMCYADKGGKCVLYIRRQRNTRRTNSKTDRSSTRSVRNWRRSDGWNGWQRAMRVAIARRWNGKMWENIASHFERIRQDVLTGAVVFSTEEHTIHYTNEQYSHFHKPIARSLTCFSKDINQLSNSLTRLVAYTKYSVYPFYFEEH